MLKWLRQKAKDEYARKFHEERLDLAKGVASLGFVTNVNKEADIGGGFIGDLYVTVGCWSCLMPELVTIGPLEDLSSETLTEVISVYLRRGELPQDGDEVVLSDRRVTLRRITETKNLTKLFSLTIDLLHLAPQLFPRDWPPLGFQVVGSLDPPRKFYEGTPGSTRTVAAEGEYDFNATHEIATRLRLESLGLDKTVSELAY